MEAVRGVDERLYRLASRYPGLRPGKCMSLYAALIDSVVKQRIVAYEYEEAKREKHSGPAGI